MNYGLLVMNFIRFIIGEKTQKLSLLKQYITNQGS